MIRLVRGTIDPKWMEIQENGVVLQEVEVLFKLWKIPKSFESVDEVFAWLQKTEQKQAKHRAYRLLSARSYPSTLLRKKLEEWGYSESVCDLIVEEFRLAGYVQDQEFWDRFIQGEFRKGNGPRLIEQKGQAKGMPKNLVRQIISVEMQKEKISDLQRKGYKSLLRKGFDPELLVEFFRR